MGIQAVDLCLVKCARSPLVGSDIALTIKSRILLSLNSSSWWWNFVKPWQSQEVAADPNHGTGFAAASTGSALGRNLDPEKRKSSTRREYLPVVKKCRKQNTGKEDHGLHHRPTVIQMELQDGTDTAAAANSARLKDWLRWKDNELLKMQD